MRYFLVKTDFDWSFKEDVECYTDDHWRMPGINCPIHPRRNPTYIDGYCYPAANVSQDSLLRRALRWGLDIPDKEVDWQEQWKEPDKWRELEARVLAVMPYAVPIAPGTAFGPATVKISGKPADWYQGFLEGHVFLSGLALEKLRSAGVRDLFTVPCELKSKRKLDPYHELQIEHTAALVNDLVASAKIVQYHHDLGYPLKCSQCGKEWGALPKRPVLKGESIPEDASLFRLKNSPTTVVCNEAFAKCATELKLTNIVFVPLSTDGSEKQRGLAKVAPSRPELWSVVTKTEVRPLKPKRKIPAQTVPLSPSAARLIDRARLSVKKAEVARLVLPSVRFVANPNQDMPVGESRLGGLPDLPEDANWPGTANAALDFLLQINLSDVSNAQPGGPLPKSGLLSFFYDSENCPSGSNPNEKTGWKVLFYEGGFSNLIRAPLPKWLSNDSPLPVCSLEFARVDSLPALTSPALVALKLSEEERERYSKVLGQIRQPRGTELPLHKVLGHPDAIQNDMAIECAMASAGLDASFQPDLKHPEQRKIAVTAKDWTLMLQLDSEEKLGLQWADAGRLFFWIRKQDLAAFKFDQCWVILQSY